MLVYSVRVHMCDALEISRRKSAQGPRLQEQQSGEHKVFNECHDITFQMNTLRSDRGENDLNLQIICLSPQPLEGLHTNKKHAQ